MGDDRAIARKPGGQRGDQARAAAVRFGAVDASGLSVAGSSSRPLARSASRPLCQRCGFEVRDRAFGCRNPCPNCGTVYPLGDCSD